MTDFDEMRPGSTLPHMHVESAAACSRAGKKKLPGNHTSIPCELQSFFFLSLGKASHVLMLQVSF